MYLRLAVPRDDEDECRVSPMSSVTRLRAQDKSESIYSPSSHRTLQSILPMIVVVVVVVVVVVEVVAVR